MTSFCASGVLTLMTDFGLADPFVGAMKGRIISRFAAAQVVDLCHEVPVHQPDVAGFWLARVFDEFPVGTVHIAVVDPGVGTERAILCMLARGHALIAPDNGLLAHCAARDPEARTVRLAANRFAALGINRVSATFHGRDIFAPVGAEVAAGRCAPDALGPSVNVTGAEIERAQDIAGAVIGRVVAVDHFGNLITNIEADRLTAIETPQVFIEERQVPMRATYGAAAPGELLALVNSFDVLEIARGRGSAAAALGLGRGAQVTVRWGNGEHLLGRPNRL